jgi:hypothetical protein
MEFVAWPKTPRLFRDIVVTEKIDGTNAAIVFEKWEGVPVIKGLTYANILETDDGDFIVGAQSRNRLLEPASLTGDKSSDNFGFAEWAYANARELFNLFGPGRHYGEWWGQGVGRNYGLDRRRFSIFNTDKWGKVKGEDEPFENMKTIGGAAVGSVPVLYHGPFSQRSIQECLYDLETLGSQAVPGFNRPEGICVYHTQSGKVYKVTLDNQDKGKWEVAE